MKKEVKVKKSIKNVLIFGLIGIVFFFILMIIGIIVEEAPANLISIGGLGIGVCLGVIIVYILKKLFEKPETKEELAEKEYEKREEEREEEKVEALWKKLGRNPLKCEICGESFATLQDVKVHKKLAHKQ